MPVRSARTFIRTAATLVLAAAPLAAAPTRAVAQTVTATWQGGAGLWVDPTRWGLANFPDNGMPEGATYRAILGPDAGLVGLENRTVALHSLVVGGGELRVTGATLSATSGIDLVGGRLALTGSTLENTAVNVAPEAALRFGSGLLRNVAIRGEAWAPSVFSVEGGLTLEGRLIATSNINVAAGSTLSGTGLLRLDSTGTIRLAAEASFAEGFRVAGRGELIGGVNRGRITADVQGTELRVVSLANQGVLEAANGGVLRLEGSTDGGVVRAEEFGTILVRSSLTLAAGALQLAPRSRLQVDSSLTYPGLIEVGPSASTLVIGGALIGATVRSTPGAAAQVSGTDALLMNTDFRCDIAAGASRMRFSGGFLSGAVRFVEQSGGEARLSFEGNWASDAAISGAVTVDLGGASTMLPGFAVVSPQASVRVLGAYSLGGGTLTLGAGTPPWEILGTLSNGTLRVTPGHRLTASLASSLLRDMTVDGALAPGSDLRIGGMLGGTPGSSIAFAPGARLLPLAGAVVRDLHLLGAPGAAIISNIDSGAFTLGPGSVLRGPWFVTAAGPITLQGAVTADTPGATLRLDPSAVLNNGLMSVGAGSTLAVGAQTPRTTGLFSSAGRLAVSTSGLLDITMPFAQTPDGVTTIGVDYAGSASSGRVRFLAGAGLGGTLRVEAPAGFAPPHGATFSLFSFLDSAPAGAFSSVALPALPGGYSWDLSSLYTQGAITVVPAPVAGVLLALAGVAASRRRRT